MKEKILCAVGAAVVLLGIAAGVIFGSDTPNRWVLTDAGGGTVNVSATGSVTIEQNPRTGRFEPIPLYNQNGVDIVIHGDAHLYGVVYHEGDRLTAEDGKLVHQSWLQARRNDLRYWASLAKKKLTGKD